MELLFYGTIFALVALSTSESTVFSLSRAYEECKNSNSFIDRSNSNMTMIESELSILMNATCLDMHNNNLEYISPNDFKSFSNLHFLNLAKNNFQKRNLDFLSGIPNLRTLVLDSSYRFYDKGHNEFDLNINSATLESLYLRHNNIEELVIPSDFHLDALSKLVLSDNNIKKITINRNGEISESNFNWLPLSVKLLKIENNNLNELILINKTQLMEVQARNNDFQTLKLENLPSLKKLMVNGEFLNEISIKNLSKLEDLLLDFDRLDRIVLSDLNGLTALETLELGCKNVSFFDGQIIDQMPSLKIFFFTRSLLRAIPQINNATHLNYLHLPENKIETLNPRDFWGMPNLEELNLADNLIRDLRPDTFTSLKKLKILNLEKNMLKNILYPVFKPLLQLEKLRLTHNSISFFDERIVGQSLFLKELFLGNNFIAEFPLITGAKHLRVLDLGGNKLQSLKEKDFGGTFLELHVLILSFNKLEIIESGTLDKLTNLKHFFLHSNKLLNLPKEWSTSLNSLEAVTLENNEFDDYEALSLNESFFQNVALSYTLKNDHFLFCTLRNGYNQNCNFPREFRENDRLMLYKKKYMTFKKIDKKFKLIPSAEK